jgi:hypothetical protein
MLPVSVVSRLRLRNWTKLIVVVLVGTWSGLACAAEFVSSDPALKTFLQNYLKDRRGPEDHTTRYSAAPVSLDDRSQMYIVYISGQSWCGSGGCAALLVRQDRSSFEVLQRFTLARLPIRVLPSVTDGWHDVTMPVRGGGETGHIALMRYSGSNYPSNPSTAPALQGPQDVGRELALTLQGELLYP